MKPIEEHAAELERLRLLDEAEDEASRLKPTPVFALCALAAPSLAYRAFLTYVHRTVSIGGRRFSILLDIIRTGRMLR